METEIRSWQIDFPVGASPAAPGIDLGKRVKVLGGRHFPLFSAGDQGRVVKIDHEAIITNSYYY